MLYLGMLVPGQTIQPPSPETQKAVIIPGNGNPLTRISQCFLCYLLPPETKMVSPLIVIDGFSFLHGLSGLFELSTHN